MSSDELKRAAISEVVRLYLEMDPYAREEYLKILKAEGGFDEWLPILTQHIWNKNQ